MGAICEEILEKQHTYLTTADKLEVIYLKYELFLTFNTA
jgi:hypothetical protein